ncbi:HpcH/HpaI aldolase/citrate lyase family protein [Frondihabitans cladoniiphilus]|uniref:HpcH/HpaI aldolase/citrate lyase family protein n=2 Tax=Frondihabitans cladoniiphilus TaxID=715785 RepID=A0ABP8W8P6_9MICO
MRHFGFLDDEHRARLFHVPPTDLSLASDPALLAVALGATLYSPGIRSSLADDVRKQAARGALSMVLCLEDSVPDDRVPEAERNVVQALADLQESGDGALLQLFVRVRTPEQLRFVADAAGDSLGVLSGFVVPKFENEDGYALRFLDALHDAQASRPSGAPRLRIMPILESPSMVHSETRTDALSRIGDVLRDHRDDVLAVRIGATDLSSAYGLRRSRDLTIYDVKVVSAVIGDIVNVLGRRDGGYVISGPVWEHFADTERILRPQLRLTPFVEASDEELRRRILLANVDGLIREITLDQANGLVGKTVIHPSHVPVVHALSVVSHEEYLDAQAIVGRTGGGAAASPYGNKMNEMKPHQAWATKTLLRAEAFGVAASTATFVDLLEASMR